MPSPRRALTRLRPLFVALAFVLLALLLRSQWDALRAYDWQIRPRWLMASGACIVGGWLIEVRLWQRILDLFGGRLTYGSAVRIWFTSTIVRYIPGNVWQPLSLTVLGRDRGIRPEATLASLSLFHVIHILAVGPIAAMYLATWGRHGGLLALLGAASGRVAVVVAVVVAAPVAFFLARPRPVLALANRVLIRMGRDPLPLQISTGRLVGLFGVSFAGWVLFCGGFTALAGAMTRDASAPLLAWAPHVAAAYPVAYAVGFLSVLTPSGLVVREGMIVLLLAPVFGRGNAIVVALAMRVWEVVLDAVVSGTAITASALLKPKGRSLKPEA